MPHNKHESKLMHFPITSLPSVMGLLGLAIVGIKLQHLFHWTISWGQYLLYGTTIYFAVLLMGLTAKLIRYPHMVKEDFKHPIRVNFFPALSICFLLLSIGYLEVGQETLARILWLIGTPLHLILLLFILHGWFHDQYELKTFNPAWFIPVVGPLLVPVAGVSLFNPEISWFFFAVGIVYWILLLAVFVNRIFFHHPLPQKLLPTLFILIAPPAVGFISYLKLTHNLDPLARILFYFGVFNLLMLVSMTGKFWKVPFFLSWWGYTFPLDAFTLSLVMMFKTSKLPIFKQAALVMGIVTTILILFVLVNTIRAAIQGKICVPED